MTLLEEIEGLTWHNAINKLKSIFKRLTSSFISDAPIDGNPYVRQDAEWVEASEGGGNFIPLSGTTVGNPITGDLVQRNDADIYQKFEDDNSDTEIGRIVNGGSSGVVYKSQAEGGNSTSFRNERIETTSLYFFISTEIAANGGRGMSSAEDYSANITDLDYTQKIYVDTKVSKGVNNSTTVVLSSATLDSTYPDATTGFRVYCASIIVGAMTYEKTPTGWLGFTCVVP